MARKIPPRSYLIYYNKLYIVWRASKELSVKEYLPMQETQEMQGWSWGNGEPLD